MQLVTLESTSTILYSFFFHSSPADFELAQLQDKLKETEEVMEEIVSKASDSPERFVLGFLSFYPMIYWLTLTGCSLLCLSQDNKRSEHSSGGGAAASA